MSNFSFKDATDYLNSLAHFAPSKVVSGEYKIGLTAIKELLGLLGNPENRLNIIHVAGTNGKGSTIAFLSEILKAANLRVGVYTSPALLRVNEQIRINNEEISDSDFAYEISEIIPHIEYMKNQNHSITTEFETITVLAFNYFLRNNCDVVIAECGLGGLTDATNVISKSLLSVITSIGLDHTEILGDTIEKIALQKAGIIKPNGTVVMMDSAQSVIEVFRNECIKKNAQLYISKNDDALSDCELGLVGNYQFNNAYLAYKSAIILRAMGFDITDDDIKAGLKNAHISCRFEIIDQKPLFVIDGSHNPPGVSALADSLITKWPSRKFYFIVGVLKDKSFGEMMAYIIPIAHKIYTVDVPSSRALSSVELNEYFRSKGCDCVCCHSYEEAIRMAKNDSKMDDIVVAFGSLYYVGQLRELLINSVKDV